MSDDMWPEQPPKKPKKVSNLDNKLREIIDSPSASRFSKADTDKSIAQIHKAFADEGYKPGYMSPPVLTVGEFDTGAAGLMPGQEWYDRFSTVLVGYACLPVDAGSVDWDSGDVMRAAKRAAGLSDD